MKWKIIIVLSFCFFLTGCWNYRELSDLSISTGISIDKEGDEYKVGMLISNAQKYKGIPKKENLKPLSLMQREKQLWRPLKISN